MSKIQNGSYSADVELSLRIDQTVFPLHKISPTRAVLRHPVDLAAGPAELVVSVDGNDEISNVRLPLGASVESAFVQIEREP